MPETDEVDVQVIEGLVAEYEMSAYGSFKWQKLVKFLENRYGIFLAMSGRIKILQVTKTHDLECQICTAHIKAQNRQTYETVQGSRYRRLQSCL